MKSELRSLFNPHPSVLMFFRADTHSTYHLNLESAWDYLSQNGALRNKTVLGVPLYGRTFLLEDPEDHEVGAPALKGSSFKVI